jgi:uncharacterized protein (TIGR02466 family)
MYELGYSSPVEIVTSWINKHKRNGYCQQHIHSNAIISGVVFIHTPDNSGLFIFKRQQPITHKLFTMQIELQKNSNTQYNTDQFVIKPISKSILLFPSSIPHYVTENETNDERVTLAFNVAPLGTIGNNEQNTVTFRNSTP